jgi:hypothetical protein
MQILLTSLTPFYIQEVGSFFSICSFIYRVFKGYACFFNDAKLLSRPTGAGNVAIPKNVLGASAFDFSHIVEKIEEVYL